MSDKKRELKSLRAISVSGRAALASNKEPEDREQVQGRVHELLADLEQEVIRDGADEKILGALERERREVYKEPDSGSADRSR